MNEAGFHFYVGKISFVLFLMVLAANDAIACVVEYRIE